MPTPTLEQVFFLLAGVMLANIGLFAILAARFEPRPVTEATLHEARLSAARLSASGPAALLEAGARLSASRRSRSLSRCTASGLSALSENERRSSLMSGEDTPSEETNQSVKRPGTERSSQRTSLLSGEDTPSEEA